MNKFFAICPFCDKSIYVEENLSGGYACSNCGQALGLAYLKEMNLIIDVVAADEEYNMAQQYFVNTDFREAGSRFAKVLEYNRNNYLAEYYFRLCEIYENEAREDFNIPAMIILAVKNSIIKMELSQVKLQSKLDFLTTILNQAFIILSSHFNSIYELYEKNEIWCDMRAKCLNIAVCVKDLTLVDKELLMVFDSSIAKSLISIADLAICACQKIVQPHLLSNKELNLPSNEEYSKAKNYYNLLFYYATGLDSNYTFSNYKPDYTGNLLYNENVLTLLNRYNADNKPNQKKYLSVVGSQLNQVRDDCTVAIQYSYHTCFKGLYVPKNDQARMALINESILFCFETLMPRISIAEDKRVAIDVKNLRNSTEIAFYLNAFLNEFYEYNKRLAIDYINKFYRQLLEMTKLYFSIVYNSYNKFVNKLKESQSKEFKYYKNFLYQIVCCCALALKEVVDFDQHNLSDRLKIIKLGKQVTEEFLLLSDYKIEEIELSSKYCDILDVFNAFDTSLVTLNTKL